MSLASIAAAFAAPPARPVSAGVNSVLPRVSRASDRDEGPTNVAAPAREPAPPASGTRGALLNALI